jgi:hypothetical protein
MQNQPQISQQQYDERVKRTSLITTVAFHVGVLMLMWFWQCSVPPEPGETLTEITWGGGGGGSPDVVGPTGPSMQGDPTEQMQQQPPEQTQQQQSSAPRNVNTPTTRNTRSPERVPTPRENQPRDNPTTPNDEPTTPQDRSDRPASDNSGGQDPQGTGDKPASGSGGPGESTGVGVGISGGVGSRGWIRKPSASGDGLNATGTVTLRFTVLPDGSITGIAPVTRPNATLVNRAIAGMSGARARALPDDVPQEAQTYTINFVFK